MASDRGNVLHFPRRPRGNETSRFSLCNDISNFWAFSAETGLLVVALNLVAFESYLLAIISCSMQLRRDLHVGKT
jgi:hypothetical protein